MDIGAIHILHVGNKLTGVGGLLISKELCAAHDARVDRVVNFQNVVFRHVDGLEWRHVWRRHDRVGRALQAIEVGVGCIGHNLKDPFLIQACGRELSTFAEPKNFNLNLRFAQLGWLEIKRVNRQRIRMV